MEANPLEANHVTQLIRRISSAITWSRLVRLSSSFVGKALLVMSVLTLLINLLSRFSEVVGHYFTVDGLRITLVGAILFVLGYVITQLASPDRVKTYGTMQAYVDRCVDRYDALTPATEFRALLNLDDYSRWHHIDETFAQLPSGYKHVDTWHRQGIAQKNGVYTLSRAQYRLLDVSRDVWRFVSAFLLLSGFALMSFTTVVNVVNALTAGG